MVVVINKGSTDTEPLVEALDTVIVFGELVIARVPMNDPSNPLSDLTGPEKVVRAISKSPCSSTSPYRLY
jgi:hypothetical protein